jgi:hypothetical protein
MSSSQYHLPESANRQNFIFYKSNGLFKEEKMPPDHQAEASCSFIVKFLKFETLRTNLKDMIYDQDEAIDEVVDVFIHTACKPADSPPKAVFTFSDRLFLKNIPNP